MGARFKGQPAQAIVGGKFDDLIVIDPSVRDKGLTADEIIKQLGAGGLTYQKFLKNLQQ